MANIHTHYDNLKVARDAPVSVIKAAYKALCQTYHPDKYQGSNEEAERIMKIVNASYVVLISPLKRATHDAWIREQEAKATEQQQYQKQDKHDTPKAEEPPPSTKANQQTHSTATEAEIKQRWEQWRNNEQKRNQKQQSWSPNGYEAYTLKRTIQEFVIAIFVIGGLFYGVNILYSKSHGQKEQTSISHQVQTQSVQAPPLSASRDKADSFSALDSQYTDNKTQSSANNSAVGCISGDCKNGQGTYISAKGSKYEGEFKNGEPNGQGVFISENGIKYVGEIKNGEPNGQGTETYTNGNNYEGEWKNHTYDGQGVFTYADGRKYVGEWKNGKENGQGTFNFANGDKYVGKWKNSLMDGQGVITAVNGDKYEGEWKNNLEDGYGTLFYAAGHRYVGEFKNGRKNGHGAFFFANGDKYVGEFKNDNGDGEITITYANGNIEKSVWRNGIKQ